MSNNIGFKILNIDYSQNIVEFKTDPGLIVLTADKKDNSIFTIILRNKLPIPERIIYSFDTIHSALLQNYSVIYLFRPYKSRV
jgi:hypothetical protein